MNSWWIHLLQLDCDSAGVVSLKEVPHEAFPMKRSLLTLVVVLNLTMCGLKPRPAVPAPAVDYGPSSVTDAYLDLWKDSQSRDPKWCAGPNCS